MDLLPLKTAPKMKCTKSTTHAKKKSWVTVEDVEDEDAPCKSSSQSNGIVLP
jgi:hypothetical protein